MTRARRSVLEVVRYRTNDGNIIYQTNVPMGNGRSQLLQVTPDGRIYGEANVSNTGRGEASFPMTERGFRDAPRNVQDVFRHETGDSTPDKLTVANRRGRTIYTGQFGYRGGQRWVTVDDGGRVIADVFDHGMGLHAAATTRWSDPKFAVLAVYLGFLSRFPDSHIVRKHGAEVAAEVCRAAMKFDARLWSAQKPAALFGELLAWDAALKARSINPGTAADLTVATLFGLRLQSVLPSGRNSG